MDEQPLVLFSGPLLCKSTRFGRSNDEEVSFHTDESYHKHSPLKGVRGVHYALQDDGFQLVWVHLIWA